MHIDHRRALWGRLADDLRPRHLNELITQTGPGELISTLDAARAGAHTGRALLIV
jgi:hypothetical protein